MCSFCFCFRKSDNATGHGLKRSLVVGIPNINLSVHACRPMKWSPIIRNNSSGQSKSRKKLLKFANQSYVVDPILHISRNFEKASTTTNKILPPTGPTKSICMRRYAPKARSLWHSFQPVRAFRTILPYVEAWWSIHITTSCWIHPFYSRMSHLLSLIS